MDFVAGHTSDQPTLCILEPGDGPNFETEALRVTRSTVKILETS